MKKGIILTSVFIALALGACNSKSNNSDGTTDSSSQTLDTTKLSKGATFYQCEMDPEIMSDKTGTCSKCGMDLEKMEKK